ncbi:MAG: CBS domain-containing protein [Nitrososphaeria archaeon]|nr:CBS domain-containing protein [Nitrososphaeria archaeon]NIN52972.1 CBS domain-containing protein [Nitrososphaeria archaeon]NIQ33531.1 CBS domain-containing protein [Nitrososphaeria archaeon]
MTQKRGEERFRSWEQINEKIGKGDVVVLTAEEFIEAVEQSSLEEAAKTVDVVTTGTFGAMCSSGAFLNFGHADPPIKIWRCWLNDVPVVGGLAAVDSFIGATAISETKGFEYGGGHVIEDLVRGKEVQLKAEAYGTDCYPRKYVETIITLEDLNQAILLNPRNAFQRYNAATNSTDRTLYTYMGTLLPRFGNVTFSGSGQLSPLYKDMNMETIGIGTRIFLGGGVGYVIGEGTQSNPQNQMATIMVRGDLNQMKPKYLRGATIHKYGVSLYVGVGIPIPIINEKVAASTALTDNQILTDILDYGVPSRDRPVLKRVSYAELKSGKVEMVGNVVSTSPLSSIKAAKEIAESLKKWIQEGRFYLSRPAELLPVHREFGGMSIRKAEPLVRDLMTREVVTAKPTEQLKATASLLVKKGIDHLPIVDDDDVLVGIVTSWDLANALASDKQALSEIMTRKVITASEGDTIDIVVRRMAQNNISGVPVVDQGNRVVGILTTDDISRKLVGRQSL